MFDQSSRASLEGAQGSPGLHSVMQAMHGVFPGINRMQTSVPTSLSIFPALASEILNVWLLEICLTGTI